MNSINPSVASPVSKRAATNKNRRKETTRFYVVSDIHGFYTEFVEALNSAGYFSDTGRKMLVICGDLMDRGEEARRVQEFVLELMSKNKCILIRGNHEDLMLDMLDTYENNVWDYITGFSNHVHNGTFDTALQLTGVSKAFAVDKPDVFVKKVRNCDFVQKIIPKALDYYETANYVFVHGWIPCLIVKEKGVGGYREFYRYDADWRNASKDAWEKARWENGMYLAVTDHVIEPNKTIVCGHWHASYGHSKYENDGHEFGEDANFKPFLADGIIAIDGCTAYTKKVNVVVLDDYV